MIFKNKSLLIIATAFVATLLLPSFAGASKLTQAGVRLGRLGSAASSNNITLVTFKLNTTPTTVASIKVTFPSGFNITAGSPTLSTTYPNTPASITAPPGMATTGTATSNGANLGGTIVASGLTSASLTNTTLYGFVIPTGFIQNPTTTGQYNITVESDNGGGSAIDTTTTPTYIVASNADQVTVNASVAPNFTFSLSANTDTVPQVDPSTIQTSPGVNMVVGTNSPLGYTAYVRSTNAALNSSISPATPIATGTFDGTPDTMTAGTTKYTFVPSTGATCSTCTGTITYDSEYAIADGTHGGAFNGTNFSSFVSRSGYTNADTIALKERVTVANTIGYANDYSDTLTVVAAGNY